ncbi:MAG: hypothetical protein JWO05_659 [Gemmatimonadetes bacterium]|nr:hypothetical protein [Gemmatimonadota bacterium]
MKRRKRKGPRFGPQIDLFPREVAVDHLDPRAVLGARTAVRQLARVRYADETITHMIFADRHGVYCQEHGPQCSAVLSSGLDVKRKQA